ncbi:hypothetical protein BKA56DRAFT_611080 [Ilyonectria sp. MPI-CAGE-AT-0026]|nr:hypothetical protein BKA56DRAFT_611080 [Ilyonectria sp. MPI-CAGE-AT-0026]
MPPEPRGLENEFTTSPRKHSVGTICTSSSSCFGVPSFSEATAVIPNPNDPPAEDEVWDEYDELFGENHINSPKSASSSEGAPFHLETYQSNLVKEKALESPTIVSDHRKASKDSKTTTGSSTYSGDMTESIRAAFQPHPSPHRPAPTHARPTPSLSLAKSQAANLYGRPDSDIFSRSLSG